MLSDALRHRLEALNRDCLPTVGRKPEQATKLELAKTAIGLTSRPAPSLEPSGLRSGSGALSRRLPQNYFDRGHEIENELGLHWLVTIPIEELWPHATKLIDSRSAVLRDSVALESTWSPVAKSLPNGLVALDLETCGLGGAALFLVGLLRHTSDGLVVELLLARTYAEEAAVLCSLWNRLTGEHILLTFNGKSFDWPTVCDRSRRWLIDRRMDLPQPTHFDLLHPARRRWKRVLPNCRLLTIERQICRRTRLGDIEGREIPAAYDRFVRTGDPEQIEPVLYHNALDLVTLLDVTLRLVE